ncbi:berberine bridge enzyme-like protein 15 [Tanacetum coccineum]
MELNISTRILPFFLSVLIVSFSLAFSQPLNNQFIPCLAMKPDTVFTPNNTQFASTLQLTAVNLRFSTPTTAKPLAIITPLTYAHAQSVVTCSKKFNYRIRIRSGGHDYAGISYTSYDKSPFVVLDLKQLRTINIDPAKKTAWVDSGATVGEFYYWVSQKAKNLAFPAGVCPTLGIGGHFSGGGAGNMARKYGLAADNVIDAKIIDANGKLLDKKAMGDDLFWAIRGGGGGNFGVVVAWNVKLVDVPDKVTTFAVIKTVDQGGSDLFNKWQTVGSKLPKDLHIRVVAIPTTAGGKRTIQLIFKSIFFGPVDALLKTVTTSFPELGLQAKDCNAMSWIESILFYADYAKGNVNVLKDRKPETRSFFNAKSDYVKEPIPKEKVPEIWKWLLEDESPLLIMDPYGGMMEEIQETSIPYSHRKGFLYKIQYFEKWDKAATSEKHISWMKKMYTNMTPFVSKNPRSAYVNYRDLDLGQNKNANATSFSEALKWGNQYYGNNFKRLASVKAAVDPQNFFYHEQSIPPQKA